MLIKSLTGTKDIFGDEVNEWIKIEKTIRDLCKDFGFSEIRTPMFEFTSLFQRGVGETTDIVQKEMYSFIDKGENHITLKPESTAPAVRAYLEHNMHAKIQPVKMYYISPAFRYEKPQAGRYRQFHQFGVEMFGSSSAVADAEVIALGDMLLKRLGLKKVELHINSLGGPECRKQYNENLAKFLENKKEHLCELCNNRRLKNPLRVLDCKNEKCQKVLTDVPTTLTSLGEECKKHFEEVQALLTAMNINFIVDGSIVRGLDYYTKTVFEFISNEIGSQGTICGGGRYDKLVEEIGGNPTPAVGFGAGIERLLLTMEAENGPMYIDNSKDIFIGYRGEEAMIEAVKLTNELRQAGLKAETDPLGRSVKAQMKYANKLEVRYSAIIGESELETKALSLKNMATGEPSILPFSDVATFLKDDTNANL
ncbi:histidine--tRNA ligase [Candidatus Epulonipiscium fishelsonii]|uniref:Histidine--tRNA ligase n=1 Tax=Candidatus Epulonipiscium fishelsonii TaxID=77094 RepID=A0ACC8XGJ8_9FIRM|nr:histidine--tRNA ligase [Epulopiscium sp. SCG-B05WGA-EpuloA1]ONI42626.1 histidine--tRNA ligase [Epulopiscium sp. SCG-B11WGA-EpuloA1]